MLIHSFIHSFENNKQKFIVLSVSKKLQCYSSYLHNLSINTNDRIERESFEKKTEL